MDLVYKYGNYYYRNLCSEGCPINTKCKWGFCVCNEGMINIKNNFLWIIATAIQCESHHSIYKKCQQFDISGFELIEGHCLRIHHAGRLHKKSGGLIECRVSQRCQEEDINYVCTGASQEEASVGRCQCRDDMRLNQWWEGCHYICLLYHHHCHGAHQHTTIHHPLHIWYISNSETLHDKHYDIT